MKKNAEKDAEVALMQELGYEFEDVELLQQALIHPSYVKCRSNKKEFLKSNQRLEFLGDRVLGLAMAKILFEKFPQSAEGGLAKYYNVMVNRETCTKISKELNLWQYLKVGLSLSKSKPADNSKILADLLEAIIAAIFIDAGFDKALNFIENKWKSHIEQITKEQNKMLINKQDAKTQLQEWFHKQGVEMPNYEVVECQGEKHQPVFTIRLKMPQDKNCFQAKGSSKKQAQQNVANKMLQYIRQKSINKNQKIENKANATKQ